MLIAVWLWVLVLAASSSEVVNASAATEQEFSRRHSGAGRKGGEPPHIVFASDQSTGELESMLAEPGVVADLIDLKAGIALAPNLTVDERTLCVN